MAHPPQGGWPQQPDPYQQGGQYPQDPYAMGDPYGQQAGGQPPQEPYTNPYGDPSAFGQQGPYGQPMPPPPQGGDRNTGLVIIASVVALAVLGGGILLYFIISGDSDDEAGDDPSPSQSSPADEPTTEPPTEPSTDPTTETSSEWPQQRFPEEGECYDDDPDYYYIWPCDSEEAVWQALKIVQSPDDPNPDQPEHDDAAYEICKDTDWTHYEWDDTAYELGETWDPDEHTIYWIMCTKQV